MGVCTALLLRLHARSALAANGSLLNEWLSTTFHMILVTLVVGLCPGMYVTHVKLGKPNLGIRVHFSLQVSFQPVQSTRLPQNVS